LILIGDHRNPSAILQSFQTKRVVVSNKVPPWNILPWREACAELDIPCHVVREEGAFIWDLRNPNPPLLVSNP
jgi:hypothetical protein